MKRKRSLLFSIGRIVGLLGIIVIVLLYLPLTVPRIFGLEIFAITSGSMEPEIPTGSVVYAEKTPAEALAEGDVAVFYGTGADQSAVTHRVLENRKDARELLTKGDANPTEDLRPVPYANVIGRMKFHLPFLGRIAIAFETTAGKIGSLAALAAAVSLYLVGDTERKKKNSSAAKAD